MARRLEVNTAEKLRATAHAKAALLGISGIQVAPSRDDHGRQTIILSVGALTREVPVAQLDDALIELKAQRLEGCTA